MGKLTKAQESLIEVVRVLGPCFSAAHLHYSPSLAPHFERAKRAGLIQSAGFETTLDAENFLHSEAGRAALKSGAPDA